MSLLSLDDIGIDVHVGRYLRLGDLCCSSTPNATANLAREKAFLGNVTLTWEESYSESFSCISLATFLGCHSLLETLVISRPCQNITSNQNGGKAVMWCRCLMVGRAQLENAHHVVNVECHGCLLSMRTVLCRQPADLFGHFCRVPG